jgi:hypothetical protein
MIRLATNHMNSARWRLGKIIIAEIAHSDVGAGLFFGPAKAAETEVNDQKAIGGMMATEEIYSNILEYTRIYSNILEYTRIYSNILEYTRIHLQRQLEL